MADFVKLYWYFDNTQGSGLAGIFITLFLYIFTCFSAGSILYMYFLRLVSQRLPLCHTHEWLSVCLGGGDQIKFMESILNRRLFRCSDGVVGVSSL